MLCTILPLKIISSRQPGNEDGRQRPVYALILRLGAGIMLATMLMLVKLLSDRNVELPQILFFRQAVSIVVLTGFLLVRRELHRLASRRVRSHAARAITGTIGMALNFGAPILLPLTVATTLGFASPIFAVILSAMFLREEVGRWRWSAVAFGFAGVIIIAGPSGADIPLLGAAVGLGGALMVAIISVQVRDLARTEDSIAIVIYFSAFSAPLLLLIALFFPWPGNTVDYLLLLLMGCFGTAGQILLTGSLRFGTVSSVIVMDYGMLIWATLYGVAVFGTLPPATLWAGAPLVISAGVIIVWREHRLARVRGAPDVV
ncbi:DMT family transporter [Croceicoccus sp. F390]|uniref:DMT family transporter n=1 Tax=Croceicoccus esteveae TaxID=3075597 RepID=A0ABU2ZF98_9SPHN|nr:DMT family transporter [Croceicoccus sp. F390]MDT0575026.1 DMT family transporter [Croceicoccus sp. F390]